MRSILGVVLSLLVLGRPAIAAAESDDWRAPDPENLLILELDAGEVLIELNPIFAPGHVAQVKKLARDGFYDGRDFYRVIEGFVAQGGAVDDIASDGDPAYFLDAEFWIEDGGGLKFTPVDRDDPFAPETGFIDGFPAGRDPATGRAWLIHCPRAVAMARGTDPDSGSTDFYIVLGHAPRYLDRNLTIFGRVVSGQRIVQRIARGERRAGGVIGDPRQRTKIRSLRISADLVPHERPRLQIQRTDSPAFLEILENRRRRDSDFFVARPPRFLDICSIPVETRRTATP